MTGRCAHCPSPEGIPCCGERARHLCDHLDPAHPTHRPEFARAIVETSRNLAGSSRLPSPAQQAANLGRALFDWACSGFRMASEEEQARRLAICHACAQWDGGWCRLCRCALWAKVRMKTEHCPLPEPKW